MRRGDFNPESPGELVKVGPSNEDVWGFLPHPLPPQIEPDLGLLNTVSSATQALGTLDGLGQTLANPYLLIRPFLRREAVASSRIEGTVADIGQLLLFEADAETEAPDSDVREVANYVRALEYGLAQPPDRALSTSLIREMHFQLMTDVRGGDRHPGRFRDVQVYIGQRGTGLRGARFVPPPPTEVPVLMRDLERYITEPSDLPPLMRIALIHYQFETIHPFEDGNGRLGRLLIPMLLCSWGLLERPLLYLSDYFDRNRNEYLDHLLFVSQRGDWRGWIDFFLDAVQTQARDALQRGKRLLSLREEYRARYQAGGSSRMLQVVDDLFDRPTLTVRGVADRLGVGYTSAQALVTILEQDGILVEMTRRKRGRVYMAAEIVEVLSGPFFTEDSAKT